jgi:hypothetical protein
MNMESKSLEEIFMELTAGETQKRGRQKPKRHKKEEAAETGNDEEEAAEALPEKAELKEDEVNDSDI